MGNVGESLVELARGLRRTRVLELGLELKVVKAQWQLLLLLLEVVARVRCVGYT